MFGWFRKYGLAAACLVGPMLAFGGAFGSIGVLMASAHIECIPLGYQFRDHDLPKTKEVASATAAEKSGAPKPEAAKGTADTAWTIGSPDVCSGKPSSLIAVKEELLSKDPSVKLDLVARHFSGAIGFTLGNAMLWLASAALLVFAAGVIFNLQDDQGRKIAGTIFGPAVSPAGYLAGAMIVAAVFAAAGTALFWHMPLLQRLVFSNVFDTADAHPWLAHMKATNRLHGFVGFNIFVGVWVVGVSMCAFFCASVRLSLPEQPSKERLQACGDRLTDRLDVIKAGLILSSILLVINVVATKTLVDWPLSLLTDDSRQALASAGNIIVQQWGVLGTLSLVSGFAPAIVAWHLDREYYRSLMSKAAGGVAKADKSKPAGKSATAPQGKPDAAQPADDKLEVKLISMVTSIIAVLAPIIASPLLSGLQSLFSALSK